MAERDERPGMPPVAAAFEGEPTKPPAEARFVVKSPGDVPETVGRNIHASADVRGGRGPVRELA